LYIFVIKFSIKLQSYEASEWVVVYDLLTLCKENRIVKNRLLYSILIIYTFENIPLSTIIMDGLLIL